ncbi:hypothetical protein DEU56DRAFT_761401 [Suillus clintonianus]|uniref:uncharacterized protein n=1 Tax=Suillus clintonianus TaxID=1904413 RepID=UPI001B8694B6|nr:uncharacterized protein DEU56DRAFT_761401 [Suillus clintonianus]KAG2117474.1 hypothetical protein DEU56DRAFT_761401 [Suillus clintonianus]
MIETRLLLRRAQLTGDIPILIDTRALLIEELLGAINTPHCSASMSTRRLTNSSKEFVSICTTRLGVDSLTISSSASRISDTAFEDAIREYRLEEQHDAEAREL